ncbi:helix-turn-helix domain-containing protein [Bacteroides thetaiotaomicron]|uniref:Helix-turn-helix domain-containing protein n=1 Tax=Bacteroides thetaiotaomicron TaxID=818 RepID=A0A6I0SB72_BACT4|nr:helix-turn-helix domain-containing protein [Bacteroides thetaiotaomicron]KAB4465336.1 helix-turn-helix domain-containing protein [Bacteroides thetaiotaomicron]KAB4474978.1 helix-turn-helix domain-containing protein [Bacteroides thetaiotaomicron]KAB4478008.1 helix-turn-helix domain-containing protein [Bacteroides thetaiotaomicron]KAB4487465.1 helix-turn-helix domain-containing protein [Bacteroides thetaiotaomicron]
MRPKSIILLSVIACIGGIAFFFACRYTYKSKVAELKEKAKKTFVEAVDRELKDRQLKGNFSVYLNLGNIVSETPDTVYLEDESGRYSYQIGLEKKHKNINNDANVRFLHSIAFGKKPLIPDSLNTKWREQLLISGISFKSALCISLTTQDGNVSSSNTYQSEWCNTSNLVFTFYIGYGYEIEVVGYLYYTMWSMIYREMLLYLFLSVVLGYGFYKSFIIISHKIKLLRTKERVEIVKEVPVEIVKEVSVEIIKEVPVEIQVIKEVQRVENISLRSYLLRENIIFYADQNLIEVDGIKQNIQAQTSLLLELFINQKDNGYILKEDFIIDKLWPDHSGNDKRMHSAIGRLRLLLRKIDTSFSIINKNGTYQLIIPEKPSVK